MIIKFDEMDESVFENFVGGEKNFYNKMHIDEMNKIMKGRLEPGASIGLHTHETSSEIIFVLKGKGKVLYDGKYEDVNEGICHYCPKGHEHSLINDSDDDLIFYAIVPMQ